MTELFCAENELRNGKTVGEAEPTVTWYRPDLSEPVTKGRNDVINMGYQERAKSWTSNCTVYDLTSILYTYINAKM